MGPQRTACSEYPFDLNHTTQLCSFRSDTSNLLTFRSLPERDCLDSPKSVGPQFIFVSAHAIRYPNESTTILRHANKRKKVVYLFSARVIPANCCFRCNNKYSTEKRDRIFTTPTTSCLRRTYGDSRGRRGTGRGQERDMQIMLCLCDSTEIHGIVRLTHRHRLPGLGNTSKLGIALHSSRSRSTRQIDL